MIETVSGLPDGVIGFNAKGRVTRKDYETVLIPGVEAALKRHDKLRLYYELGREFDGIDSGAMLEDFELGIRRLPHWEKLAVVTDVEWIRMAVNAFAFMIHGKVKVFPASEARAARDWIAAN